MKGLHWGKLEIGESNLEFKINDKQQTKNLFKVPLANINTSSINKNDIILQLKDSTANSQTQQQDLLCEIRFYVDVPKLEEQNQENGGEEGEKKQVINHAEVIHQQIMEKANIGVSSGESIAKLQEISLGVPRGKYTIDFYEKNLRFHGSTFNYNVDYKNIQKGIILPMNHENKTAIVLQLSKPIIQGQTIHPFIVVLLPRDEQEKIATNVKPQYLKDHPHLQKVKAQYEGSTQSVVVELLKSITNIDLVIPGQYFKSQEGNPYVKCSRKTNSGLLYFLKKSLIFIMKPVIYFKVDDIEKVQFHRVGAANKQFDIKIFIKNKSPDQYVGIDKAEYQALAEYLKQKQVKTVKVGGEQKRVQVEVGSDSSQDEDFEGGDGSDSQDDDDSQLIEESNSQK